MPNVDKAIAEPPHLQRQQSIVTGKNAPQVMFAPQPDITAFELAELLRLFTILVANGNPAKNLTVASDHVRGLSPETRRHFNEAAAYGKLPLATFSPTEK